MHRFVIVCRVACVFGLMLWVAPVSWADYAAIAYCPTTGTYGHSSGCCSRGEAERLAVRACCGPDARVVVWVHNGYAALAIGERAGTIGWGWSTRSRTEAEVNALRNARECGCRSPMLAQWVYSR